MKQREFYDAPELEIVDCRVEAGFANTTIPQVESVKEGETDWD